jgi:hypothetical protein
MSEDNIHIYYHYFGDKKHKVEQLDYHFKILYMCYLCRKYIPESEVKIMYLTGKGSSGLNEIESIESVKV